MGERAITLVSGACPRRQNPTPARPGRRTRLGPHVVGQRIVVRHRLPDGSRDRRPRRLHGVGRGLADRRPRRARARSRSPSPTWSPASPCRRARRCAPGSRRRRSRSTSARSGRRSRPSRWATGCCAPLPRTAGGCGDGATRRSRCASPASAGRTRPARVRAFYDALEQTAERPGAARVRGRGRRSRRSASPGRRRRTPTPSSRPSHVRSGPCAQSRPTCARRSRSRRTDATVSLDDGAARRVAASCPATGCSSRPSTVDPAHRRRGLGDRRARRAARLGRVARRDDGAAARRDRQHRRDRALRAARLRHPPHQPLPRRPASGRCPRGAGSESAPMSDDREA